LSRREQADPDQAIAHFQNALRFALESADTRLIAWAHLHILRTLAELRSFEELAGVLRETRAAVANAADAQASSYLHDAIALMEASAGRIPAGRKHLRISQNLLSASPHAGLEQSSFVSAFSLDFRECNFGSALKNIRSARRLLSVTGPERRLLIDNNEANALLMTGEFNLAMPLLEQVAAKATPYVAIAALDGLAQVYLATNRLEDCESTLERTSHLLLHRGPVAALPSRDVPIVKLKLLMRRDRWEEAATEAELHLTSARKLGDSLLIASLCCLRAEALAGAGRSAEAARMLFEADVASSIPSRLGGYYRAAGFVLRQSGHALGQAMFARAKAIWDEQQNRYELIEAQPVFKAPVGAGTAAKPLGKSPSAVNALAAVFSVARSPRLVGRELLHIIDTLGCADDVALVDGPPTASESASSGAHSVTLGEHRGRPVRLTCRLPADPQLAMLLSDVLRIGRAAVELEVHREAERNRAALWTESPAEEHTGALFVSEEMQSLLATARRIASTTVPVLITGETGTGKEVLARVIHAYSARAKAPFLPFNCTSTPKDMLDSQLFGHRRGSFTGATESFPGVIRGASGGTLFLDEIGDMGLDVQPKLLRFLDSNEVHPIGETHPVRADVRVIAATNADLDGLVSQGRFREDLFYRLNIVRLHLPPLRERRVEIPSLVHHYLQKFAREYTKGDLRLAEETMDYLLLYRWPGNVRQLANEMRRLAALAETGAVLMPEHLSKDILASRRTLPPSERALTLTEVVVRLDQPMAAAVEHVERSMVLYALKQCGGRIDETATMLGLSRKGLYLKRQRFGIDTGEDVQLTAGAA
jgi:DNA-binding NtrC family response regulator/tetratricopeptide (TPR) repeat protein